MEYSRGEWKQEEFTVQDYGEPIKHIYISPDSGEHANRTLADIGFWRDFNESEVRANAHLIAASPQLYEALKEYQYANRIHNDNEARLFDIGRRALAKANGK